MEEYIEIIDNYNQLLYDIYNIENLKCLSDNNCTYKGINILALSNPAVVDTVRVGLYEKLNQVIKDKKLLNFNHMHAENELIICTADLKYRLGILYLYFPLIIKLQYSFYYHNEEIHYVYNQNRDDARFNRELPVAFECIYKFWQRLSDYILSFFPDELFNCEGKSYFHTPIRYICKNHSNLTLSDNFQWLINFSENIYPKFNKKRKFFVHTAGYDNQFFKDFINASSKNKESMIEMDRERENLLPYLKEQLELCLEGYIYVMNFLNEIKFELKESENSKENQFRYSLK
jgi:hypothetical protein